MKWRAIPRNWNWNWVNMKIKNSIIDDIGDDGGGVEKESSAGSWKTNA